ncbi:hypothetical protein ABVV53_09305 [Novosphingobium sp. RD2P27]|uniref:Uncharacterized protein n=1 Tax=Novosphingobium kalidii TaxID=3230299 RepID=A0ABV2D1G3_9SPHN
MDSSDNRREADNSNPAAESETRPQKGGEAATTRFGMEDGDNTDVPATGVDSERQSPSKR